MGRSNLRASLYGKMNFWAGELEEKSAELNRIQALLEQVPDLQTRTRRLQQVLASANDIMREIDPGWNPDRVRPKKLHIKKSPVATGDIARITLDILREENGTPQTVREIARKVLERSQITESEPDLLQKTCNAVDATLRQKKKKQLVDHNGLKFARKWRIVI